MWVMVRIRKWKQPENLARLNLRVTTWKGHADASKDIVKWFQNLNSQLKQVETLCVDDHQMNDEEFEVTGELAPVCLQIVLT